jgi:hypothetical protein
VRKRQLVIMTVAVGLFVLALTLTLAALPAVNAKTGRGEARTGQPHYVAQAPETRPDDCGPGTWTTKAPYPVIVVVQAAVWQGGILYSFGGSIGPRVSVTDSYKYNPNTNSWTAIAPLPAPRAEASAVSDGTYIYILNGYDETYQPHPTLYRYDPSTNSYLILPNAPQATLYQAAVYLGGRIYRIAGDTSGGTRTDSVDVFNVSTGTWAPQGTIANYPIATWGISAVTYGNYIFSGLGSFSALSKTYRYDPASNVWNDEAVTDVPDTLRSGAVTGILNGYWILAGQTFDSPPAGLTLALDISNPTGGWTTLSPVPLARFGAAGGSNGQALYAVGGLDNNNGEHQENQQFTLGPCITPTPSICDLPPGETSTNLAHRPPNRHSMITTKDTLNLNSTSRDIYDTVVASWLQAALAPGGNSDVRDATFLFNECFAGGMLDALQVTFGGSEGVRWAGGAASKWNEYAYGWPYPPGRAPWTGALLPEMRANETTLSAVATAAANDASRQIPVTPEAGQWASGSGGDTFSLPDACSTSHYAILWAGYMRPGEMWFYQTISDFREALLSHWPSGTTTIITLFGDGQHDNNGHPLPTEWQARPASATELQQAISQVGNSMGPTDQFVFYVFGHGSFSYGIPHSPADGDTRGKNGQDDTVNFDMTEEDLSALRGQTINGETFHLDFDGTLDSSTSVAVNFNEVPLGYLQQGTHSVDFNVPQRLLALSNHIRLDSVNSNPITIRSGEFRSGPVGARALDPGSGAGTSTPTQTATPCPLQFTDVPVGSPFYDYVRILVCRGVISGYADGTFRPGANVTRGQASKFVVNAVGLNDPVPRSQQGFEDVAPDGPFWIYIERLSGKGYISGYTCGQAPAGPCVHPLDRPYFLPGNNVTRGQLSKIVANAAGLDEGVGGQLYQDVPNSNPFYSFIERLALHGVISGYACGPSPAGNCIEPGNLPYFAPGNNVTRGQTSKIVANTFFPGVITPSRK